MVCLQARRSSSILHIVTSICKQSWMMVERHYSGDILNWPCNKEDMYI